MLRWIRWIAWKEYLQSAFAKASARPGKGAAIVFFEKSDGVGGRKPVPSTGQPQGAVTPENPTDGWFFAVTGGCEGSWRRCRDLLKCTDTSEKV